MTRATLPLLAFLFLSLTACAASQPATPQNLATTQPPAPRSDTSPLYALQAEFRPAYNTARAAVESEVTPLIVDRFDDIYLLQAGKPTIQAKAIPEKYNLLHRTAHVPFVIYLKLRPVFGKPLTKPLADDLAAYKLKIDAAIPDLANRGFSPQELQTQRTLLQDSSNYIASLHAGAVVDPAAFESFRAKFLKPTFELMDAAAAAQIDTLHALMKQWHARLSPADWARVRVLIVGPRQPRNSYTVSQYFSALFPAPSNSIFPFESTRVFYIETLNFDFSDTTFKPQRRAIATLLLDTQVSQTYFNNPTRMSTDLLADAAARRIAELDFTPLR